MSDENKMKFYVKLHINIYFVRWTARHAIHLRFKISANAFEIRAVQNSKFLVWYVVDCTC
jgi:hypothetical protein